MFNLKADAAKKKKQALRRLSQSSSKTKTPQGKLVAKAVRATGVKGQAKQTSGNPFLKASKPSSGGAQISQVPKTSSANPSASDLPAPLSSNPFLAAVNKPSTANPGPAPRPPPPSYAAVAGGKRLLTDPRVCAPAPRSSNTTSATQPPANVNPFLAKNPTLAPARVNTGQQRHEVGVVSQVPIGKVGMPPQLPEGVVSQVPMGGVPKMPPGQVRKPVTTSTVLHVKGVPPQLNNEIFLLEHFSKFGRVKTVKCNGTKMFAQVSFLTHEDAAKAKRYGKHVLPNTTLTIFWHSGRTQAQQGMVAPGVVQPQPQSGQAGAQSQSQQGQGVAVRPQLQSRAQLAQFQSRTQLDPPQQVIAGAQLQQHQNGTLRSQLQLPSQGTGAQPQPQEGMARAQLQEGMARAQLQEGMARAQLQEGMARAQLQEGMARAQLQEGMARAQLQEGMARAQLQEGMARAQSQEGMARAQSQEGIARAQSQEGMARAQFQEGMARAQYQIHQQQQVQLQQQSGAIREPRPQSQQDVVTRPQHSVQELEDHMPPPYAQAIRTIVRNAPTQDVEEEERTWEPEEGEQERPPLQELAQAQQQEVTKPPAKRSVFDRLGEKVTKEDEVKQQHTKKRQMVAYDEEDWLPGQDDAQQETRDDNTDDIDKGLPPRTGLVSQAVLRDLGNKFTGDEMDTIARTAPHSYYLRSLDQLQSGGAVVVKANPGTRVTFVPAPSAQTVVCPYAIPKPNLPPPPRPKGNSAGDFYEALDSRDQEIRKGMKKHTSLMEAEVIVGTCPDMCPEKERYRREDTHRLSFFEMSSDSEHRNPKVDHTLAVKEYSGSAADKEAPLPHDLRPLGVLQMTMDYLVTTVMDAGSNRPYDWYDFLWNRTRGIRKDITIQHLCHPECVALTEKCARFHILCAHHLCEEEMSTFDPKLNNENLNKCLLSLKQFYRDLRLGQGILCPNEAEFCCYDILLHLNKGNVLNIVQEYSPEIREAPLVTFAVKVALYFEANNFIRFFKLLRSTSFLNACILHRYLPVVRCHALRVLNRSHSMQKHFIAFPLRDLTRMLAFGTELQTVQFCELFELEVEVEKKRVKFDRVKTDSIVLEERSVTVTKSPHLVLSKNSKSLGEVVNGGPLPPRYIHTPYSSFTAGGLVTDMPDGRPASEEVYPLSEVTGAVQELLEEEIGEGVGELAQECVEEAQEAELALVEKEVTETTSAEFCSTLVSSVVDELTQQVVAEALEDAMFVSSVLEAACREEAAMLTEAVVMEMVGEVVRDCVLEVQAKEQVTVDLCKDLILSCVEEEVKDIASKALAAAKQRRRRRLEALRKKFLQHQLHKYWDKWCVRFQERQHFMRCAEAVPPLPPIVSLPCQLERLLPQARRQYLGNTDDDRNAKLLETSIADLEKRRGQFYSPLDLPSLLQDQLLASQESGDHVSSQLPDVYWKLLFLYPHKIEMGEMDKEGLYWLCSKLGSASPSWAELGRPLLPLCNTSSPLLCSESAESAAEPDPYSRRMVLSVFGVCTGACGGLDVEQRRLAVQGARSLVVYVPAPRDVTTTPPQSYVTGRLDLAMEVLGKDGVRVPLLVIYSSELEEKCLAFWYRSMRALQSYCEDVAILDILWMKLDLQTFSTTAYPESHPLLFSQSLQQLVRISPPQPNLFHMPVSDYLEQGLLKHFTPLVMSDRQKRQEAHLPSQPLSPLVYLYNAVLAHLTARATRRELQHIQWPPPEFKPPLKFTPGRLPPLYWNSAVYLENIHQCLTQLVMPGGGGRGEEEEEGWSRQCARCMEYVSAVIASRGEEEGQECIPLYSSIKSILLQHSLKFEADQSCCCVPWDQVLLTCVEYILSSLDSDLWVSGYRGDDAEMVLPVEWLRAQANTSLSSAARVSCVNATPTSSATHGRRHKRLLSDSASQHTPTTRTSPRLQSSAPVYRGSKTEERKRQRLDQSADSEQELPRRLECSIEREKELSQRFETQLRQWMESPTPSLLTPARAAVSEGAAALSNTTPTLTYPVTESVGSFRDSLKQLSRRTRSLRWQDTMDTVWLHSLTNDYPLD